MRHWRGELSLAKSFWVNYFLITFALTLVGFVDSFGFVINRVIDVFPIIWAAAFFSIGFYLALTIGVLLITWQLVGIWRSARNHCNKRSALWGRVAQVVVVIAVISEARQFFSTASAFSEIMKIALGHDPIGSYELYVSQDATYLALKGSIAFGVTDDVRRTLDAYPTVQIIDLNSEGGRVAEGRKLRDLIGSRGLVTYTSTACYSACTLAYAAGKERHIRAGAVLGFHQPIGGKDEPYYDKQDWVKRGFRQEFIEKAFSTPNSDLWTPTHKELFDAGFITDLPIPE